MIGRIFLRSVSWWFVLFVASARSELLPTSQPEPKYFEDILIETHGKIIFSSIIFRHGDCNPTASYPTDPYKEYFEENGMGRLISIGKRRVHRLGSWARARYADLLSGSPNPASAFEAKSSDIDRAIESAQMFLAGFSPPTSVEETQNNTFPWQPAPVHTISRQEDNVLSLRMRCFKYSWEMKRLKESLPSMTRFYEDLGEDFFAHIERNTQLEIPRNDSIPAMMILVGLYDSLHVQQHLGMTLPAWTERVYPYPLISVPQKYFELITFNTKTKRLKTGPLLNRIIGPMIDKRNTVQNGTKSNSKVIQIFSGHDTTLAVLMNTLGVYDFVQPPYSAAILVELRRKDGNYFVTLLYRKSEEEPPTLLEIPGCKNPCSFNRFLEFVSPFRTFTYRSECNNVDSDYNSILFRG